MIIGEAIRDNATQTDISEVPCIKLLTAQADKLKEERDEILTTQENTWKTMEAAYSKNLSEQEHGLTKPKRNEYYWYFYSHHNVHKFLIG